MTRSPDATARFTLRCNFPYSVGLLLAVNAVPDAALLLDGPSCGFHKGELIHGNHDLTSTLLDAAGAHRVTTSDADVFNITQDRRAAIAARLDALRGHPDLGAVLLASLPMAAVVGTDLGALARRPGRPRLADGPADGPADRATPVLVVPPDPFDGDWLDGFAAALTALATAVELGDAPTSPDTVAVVGYPWDRGEGDHRANVAELGRLLRGIGLTPAAPWVSGVPFARAGEPDLEGTPAEAPHLAAAGRAGLIVSLPHGRAAARALVARTGARLVETDLPLGLDGTARWLRAVAAAADRAAAAEALVDRELAHAVPRLRWTVEHHLLHRRVALLGDPFVGAGLAGMLDELGVDRGPWRALARAHHAAALRDRSAWSRDGTPDGPVDPARFEPHAADLDAALAAAEASAPLDLVFAPTHYLHLIRRRELPFLEFGFPNAIAHRLTDAPWLGFRGCLRLAEQIANRVALFDTLARGSGFGS